jgi:hypothetical protein
MTAWAEAAETQLQEAIAVMEHALRACPDELWNASLWTVRPEGDVGGGMMDLPADERVQLLSAVWNIAHHATFHLDLMLSRRELPFESPPPFRTDDHLVGAGDWRALPARVYSRGELLGYLDHCRRKVSQILPSLTEEDLESFVGKRPFADRLLQSLVHMWEHATQIHMFLGSDPREPERQGA